MMPIDTAIPVDLTPAAPVVVPVSPPTPNALRVECPFCATSYTAARTGLSGEPGIFFTVSCLVCLNAFNGWFELQDDVPPSLLHKWTFGWFGQPAITGATLVRTVKRT